MKCRGPGSERSRHINIGHFCLKEIADQTEVIIEHFGNETCQTIFNRSAQFDRERNGSSVTDESDLDPGVCSTCSEEESES